MFSVLPKSVVLYPCDAVSMKKCLLLSQRTQGITYIRSTRAELPILYNEKNDECAIGGSTMFRQSDLDAVLVIACGITVHEALRAYDILEKEGTYIRVMDVYNIKPIDSNTILSSMETIHRIITVEDHYERGGLADVVRQVLCSAENQEKIIFRSLAVRKTPRSGKPEELLRYEEIDAESIVKTVKEIL